MTSSALLSTHVFLPEAILDLYNWPSDSGETWRHITDFHLVNSRGELTSPEIYEGTSGCVLRGCLLPPPSADNAPSAIMKRLVAIRISHFSIDFGEDDADESRGFWLSDQDESWYRLEAPSPEYQALAQKTKIKCEKFLQFYDVVVHMELGVAVKMEVKVEGAERRPGAGVGAGVSYLSTHDPETDTYSCHFTLSEVLERCGGQFDLDFLKANACFYLEQLQNQLTPDCVLMRDIKVSLSLSVSVSVSVFVCLISVSLSVCLYVRAVAVADYSAGGTQ